MSFMWLRATEANDIDTLPDRLVERNVIHITLTHKGYSGQVAIDAVSIFVLIARWTSTDDCRSSNSDNVLPAAMNIFSTSHTNGYPNRDQLDTGPHEPDSAVLYTMCVQSSSVNTTQDRFTIQPIPVQETFTS